MTATQYLSDEEFAQYFIASNYVRAEDDVLDIEPRVEGWLSRSGMSHRNAFKIAIEVSKLAKPEPAPVRVPTAEEAALENDRMQGYGNSQQLTAEQIARLDMAAYAKLRAQIGIGRAEEAGIFAPIMDGH